MSRSVSARIAVRNSWCSSVRLNRSKEESVAVMGFLIVGFCDWSVVELGECGLGGVVSTHAVCTGTGRGGRRADVHAGQPNAVRRQRDSRAEDELADVFRAGHDVAAHEIRFVGSHL